MAPSPFFACAVASEQVPGSGLNVWAGQHCHDKGLEWVFECFKLAPHLQTPTCPSAASVCVSILRSGFWAFQKSCAHMRLLVLMGDPRIPLRSSECTSPDSSSNLTCNVNSTEVPEGWIPESERDLPMLMLPAVGRLASSSHPVWIIGPPFSSTARVSAE